MFRRIIPSKKLFFYMINRKKVFAVGAGLAPARHTSTYVRLLWGIGTASGNADDADSRRGRTRISF